MSRLRDVGYGILWLLLVLGLFSAWGNEDRRAVSASRELLYVGCDTVTIWIAGAEQTVVVPHGAVPEFRFHFRPTKD